MIQDALDGGLIDLATTVVESTSGNTGVGLAQACRYHGIRLICVVDARAHASSVRAMRALGADVRIVEEPDPRDRRPARRAAALVRQLLAEIPNSFWPDQYANESNPAAHAAGTMREIDEALEGRLDYLFVATSTTGTLRGCGDYLREHGAQHAHRRGRLDRQRALRRRARRRAGSPASAPASRRELSAEADHDELVRVSDLDCVVGCRRLAEREAILAGASSGGVAFALEALSRRWSRAAAAR